MSAVRLPKYVQAFVDRTGRPRFYFRKGRFRVALPAEPYSTAFMTSYEAAKAHCDLHVEQALVLPGLDRLKPGSLNALIASYYCSSEFKNLKPITQSTYRNRIEAFRRQHGERMLSELQRKHVVSLMAKQSTPDKANRLLKTLRTLTRHALNLDLIAVDPCHQIRKLKTGSTGFATWTDQDIAKFYATHKLGTRARLAMDLLLHTGQRRQDIVLLGPRHIVGDQIVVAQSKTGSLVAIPLYGALVDIVAQTPTDQPAFLMGQNGKPLTPEGFTNWFRKCVIEAVLPKGLSPHGLRKAVCRRLAEAGCSEHEIMAISGHKNIKEVSVYTKAADRSHMARQAVKAMEAAKPAAEN